MKNSNNMLEIDYEIDLNRIAELDFDELMPKEHEKWVEIIFESLKNLLTQKQEIKEKITKQKLLERNFILKINYQERFLSNENLTKEYYSSLQNVWNPIKKVSIYWQKR